MTAATAFSSIPAEICFEPFQIGPNRGHFSLLSGSSSSRSRLPHITTAAATAAATATLAPMSNHSISAPISPMSDSTVVSPIASTPRAASPSPKRKGRAGEEELAGLDAESIAHQLATPTVLSAPATSSALLAQAAVSQHLTQPLLQALDQAHQDQREVERLLVLDQASDPPPDAKQGSRPSPAAAAAAAIDGTTPVDSQQSPSAENGTAAAVDTAADAQGERASSLAAHPTAQGTASAGASSYGSDGEYEDAAESSASPPVVDAKLSAEDVNTSSSASPPSRPPSQLPLGLPHENAGPAATATATASASTAAEDEVNRPVLTAQPDISRTPSTSTTGSSHAGSVDTAISSAHSTAASSCPGCPERSCDTLKVVVDGEPSVDASRNSPLSFVSEPAEVAPAPGTSALMSSSPVAEDSGTAFPSLSTSAPATTSERRGEAMVADGSTITTAAATAAATQTRQQQEDKAVQAKVRRYAALLELVETERNYADDLATLVLVFFDNLCTMPYFEDQPSRHALVTRNSEDLLRLHQRLSARMDAIMSELGLRRGAFASASAAPASERAARSDLEKALSPEADEAVVRVAKLFTGMMPSLQGYKAFCSRHGEALTLVREAEKRHADWDAFERRCSDILRMSRAPGYGASRPPSGASTPSVGTAAASSPASYFTPIVPPSSNANADSNGRSSFSSGPGSGSGSGFASGSTSAAVTPGSVHSAIRQNSSRLLFRDFLIKPVQRLCLYPLVLQTLLKHTTSSGTVGSAELSTAIALMREVADQVDEAGRRRELELMSDLITSRVEAHHGVSLGFLRSLGECRLAGTLDVLHHHRTLDPLVAPLRFKYFGVFLYDGFILLVKVKKGPAYECRQWFPLWAARLSNVEEGSSLLPHSFRLSVRSHHFEIAASNARERQVWIDALSTCISNATLTPPGTEANFPSSLFLGGGDGSDSDGNANSAGATPSANRGADAASYWDAVRPAVGDPLMEFFAQHAASAVASPPQSSTAALSSSGAIVAEKGQKSTAAAAAPAAATATASSNTPCAGAASSASASSTAAAAAAAAVATSSSWIPTEILLRHASPSSRSVVDRGMVFSDLVLHARSSKDAGDLSSLWLPHNQTLGSAVGTAIGFSRLSAKDTSTVKIQRRKSCIGSLESADAGAARTEGGQQFLFTATVMQPGFARARPSARSIADFSSAGDAGGATASWKASLRKKASKVRPPSIFAPNGLTVRTDDLSPRSPHSAKSTPTSPIQFTRDLQTIEFGVPPVPQMPASGAADMPQLGGGAVSGGQQLRQGSADISISSNSSPRPGHGNPGGFQTQTPFGGGGLNSNASLFVNLRSAAAADGWRSSSIYGMKETLSASFGGGRRSRTRSAQTDATDLSADVSVSSRGVSPMSSTTALPQAVAIDEQGGHAQMDASAAAMPTTTTTTHGEQMTGRLRSGSRSNAMRPSSLRRALTSASLTGRKRTQSDVGMLLGLDGKPTGTAASGPPLSTTMLPTRRLERTNTNVTMPADERRKSGGSVSLRKGLSRRFGDNGTSVDAQNPGSKETLGGSLRRSRTMLFSGQTWLGSLSSSDTTTVGVDRVHGVSMPSGSVMAAQDGISPKGSPSLDGRDTFISSGDDAFERMETATSTSASSRPLSQCRSFTDPELASKVGSASVISSEPLRGREVTRSESAPAVPLVAKASDSPKRGSRMFNTLRFLHSNRLATIPLKAVAETSIEHSDTLPSSSAAASSPRHGSSPVKGRISLPARLSLLDNQTAVSTSTGRNDAGGKKN